MNSKIIILFLLCLSIMLMAAGEYRKHQGTHHFTVVTDSGGDSTYVSQTLFDIGEVSGFRTLHGRVIMENATPNPAGLGNQDSVWLWIYTQLVDENILVDSTVKEGLPCTLTTVIHSNVGDTLLRRNLQVGYQLYDSLGDTLATVSYPIKYYFRLK